MGVAPGIGTGLIDLDPILTGLHDGELTIIAARPSCGKTSLGLSILSHACGARRLPALFVSLEQHRQELCERLLACYAEINSQDIRKGTIQGLEIDRVLSAKASMSSWSLFIHDAPQNLQRIAAIARRLKRRHGLRMIVIDYLQLLEPENSKSPRQEQVASMSRRMKLLARELNIPVVCMAQLNREVEGRTDHKPRLADLRESGAIEQDADVVMFLHRPDYYAETDRPGQVDIHVAKNRNGPTGMATVYFRREFARFYNFARQ
jgi:replicative DNA helicase